MKNGLILCLGSLLLLISCEKNSLNYPDCINTLIQQQRSEISAVYRYSYLASTVYDFNPEGECCDFTNTIYSEDCKVICVLNGIAGIQICAGDTFYLKATDKTLIWKK